MVKRIIEFAVGAIMLGGVLLIGFSYYNRGKDYASIVENKNAVLLQEKEEWFLTRYEGLEPSGSDIIKYVKSNIDRVDQIKVTTNKKTFIAGSEQFSSYQVSTSDFYIDPLKHYTVQVKRNENDVITEIVIRQK